MKMSVFYNKEENPFKDKQSRWRTQSLFMEYRRKGMLPLFTLKSEDSFYTDEEGVKHDVKSLKKLYLGFTHVPYFEYQFANECLGGWEHFNAILRNGVISPFVKSWREEMELKLQAEALRSIMHLSKDPKGFAAAKYLADKGWKGLRGRPSMDEVEKTKKAIAMASSEVEDDLQRMGLTLVK